MGVLRVLGVVTRNENDVGANLFGFADLGSGFDAEFLGLVARSDAAGGIGHRGDYGERPVSILRVQLLFYRREETVQVDVQETESIGMGGVGHSCGSHYISLFICLNCVVRDAEWVAKM